MKLTKIFTLLLALTLVFSLVACNNGNTKDPSESQQGSNTPLNREDDTSSTNNQGGTNNSSNEVSIDIGSIMSGNGSTDVVYGQMDEATKQAIIDAAKEDGCDISFGADGSTTFVYEDGTTVVQKSDGTYVVKDADGNEGQVGGNWPDNEYTKLVPQPDFELTAARVDDEGFVVAFQGATLDQIKDYVTKVKAAGFTLNEELTDENMMGYQMYTFYAENSTGYSVEITSAMGTTGMTISKIN